MRHDTNEPVVLRRFRDGTDFSGRICSRGEHGFAIDVDANDWSKGDRLSVQSESGTLEAEEAIVVSVNGTRMQRLGCAQSLEWVSPDSLTSMSCLDASPSDYERATRALLNGVRDLPALTLRRGVKTQMLLAPLAIALHAACDHVADHLMVRHGQHFDIFVDIIGPLSPNSLRHNSLPDSILSLASSVSMIPGDKVPAFSFDSSPHLKELWSLQGTEDRSSESDFLYIDNRIETRFDRRYLSGASVALRMGHIPPAPSSRAASDIIGFLSAYSAGEAIPRSTLVAVTHTLRSFSNDLMLALVSYETARNYLSRRGIAHRARRLIRKTNDNFSYRRPDN